MTRLMIVGFYVIAGSILYIIGYVAFQMFIPLLMSLQVVTAQHFIVAEQLLRSIEVEQLVKAAAVVIGIATAVFFTPRLYGFFFTPADVFDERLRDSKKKELRRRMQGILKHDANRPKSAGTAD